ncbi:YeeE/YedE family protein [Thalassotalea crassostreae]|uniref:YeeE/YedE family protein n=1 Tax=Thalassotalea crassostreae TaxID=1763536 RepID=UPI000838E899|nr:YeeE/YedE family protein [Thalassotalea crassostreae]
MSKIFALLCGILFGIGLTVAQMVDPNKVINFLDLFGYWDASLAFVMGGALVIYIIGYQFIVKNQQQPKCAAEFDLPTNTKVDKKLIIGSATFGLGWGISGICPGPAISNLTSGDLKIFGFLFTMLIGMLVAEKLSQKSG